MKKTIWMPVGMLAAMVLVFGAGAPQAFASGAGVGNGGDRYAIEFVSLAHRVLDEVKVVASMQPLGFEPMEYEAAIAKTAVESSEKPLELNGVPKDAINYPEETPPRITLGRAAWDRLADASGLSRRILVLHEYLGVMKRDDSRYQITSLVFNNSQIVDPCAGDDSRVWDMAVEKFKRSGHNVTRDNIDVGNGGSTLDGTHIRVMRGYEIKEGKWINALLYAAQCNWETGKYEELFYSGSGASLAPSCEGQAKRFCTGK